MDIFSHVVLEITPSHLSESWKDPKNFKKQAECCWLCIVTVLFEGKVTHFNHIHFQLILLKGVPKFSQKFKFYH